MRSLNLILTLVLAVNILSCGKEGSRDVDLCSGIIAPLKAAYGEPETVSSEHIDKVHGDLVAAVYLYPTQGFSTNIRAKDKEGTCSNYFFNVNTATFCGTCVAGVCDGTCSQNAGDCAKAGCS